MSQAGRVEYSDGDLLTSRDLNARQLYQIELGRRHRRAAHLPGVVTGLEIVTVGDDLFLTEGYAVDGFGRDLTLPTRTKLATPLAEAQIREPGADTFEVLLHYEKQPLPKDSPYFDETPRVELRALIGGHEPPPPYDVTEVAPDDPAFERPVRVGVLTAPADGAKGWVLRGKPGDRQETGVVATRLTPSASGVAGLTLSDGEFSVVLPASPETGEDARRLSVRADGADFRGALSVEGDIEAGGHLLLTTAASAPTGAAGCGFFRIGDPEAAPDTHELRLVLPVKGALTVGAVNPQSGKFEAILTVDAATRSVLVAGDLIVDGATMQPIVNGPKPGADDPAKAADKEKQNNAEGAMPNNGWMAVVTGLLGGGRGTLAVIALLMFGVLKWDRALTTVLSCEAASQLRKVFDMSPPACHENILIGGSCHAEHKEAEELFNKLQKLKFEDDHSQLKKILDSKPDIGVYCKDEVARAREGVTKVARPPEVKASPASDAKLTPDAKASSTPEVKASASPEVKPSPTVTPQPTETK